MSTDLTCAHFRGVGTMPIFRDRLTVDVTRGPILYSKSLKSHVGVGSSSHDFTGEDCNRVLISASVASTLHIFPIVYHVCHACVVGH